ncbi:unnamed protein product [Clonostachys solani]|uniref:Uncharacterized protein n=1 Tax=Clonostachys solani TaxID=160281 RepID=A0A9N9W2X7_9HYPO|nr:unnamed protein product [Clonostachys solani]
MPEVLLRVDKYPFADEAGVFIERSNELFVISAQCVDSSGVKKAQISKILLGNGTKPAVQEEIPCDQIQMGNGRVNYQGGSFFCSQASLSEPSGLFKTEADDHHVKLVVTS